jgi:hypothetical protein
MRRAPKTMLAAIAALALLATVTVPTTAHAGDDAGAEVLFREGVDHMKKGEFAAACDAFDASNKADPSPGTLINLGLCNEKQGKLASAWNAYLKAVPIAKEKNQKDRADTARKEAERLEPLLLKLIIKGNTGVEGLTVTRDGVPVALPILGKEVPVDPGEHVIEVSAKGKKPLKRTVSVAGSPGSPTVFEIPALEDAPVDPNASPTPGSDARPPASSGGSDGSTQRNVGFVLGGAGIVALLAGGVIQIIALGVNSDASDIDLKRRDTTNGQVDCSDPKVPAATTKAGSTCGSLNESYDTKKDAANANQLGAIVTAAGGAVLIGVGATLILTSGSSKSSSKTTLIPLLGTSQAGLGISGSF